MAAAKQRRVNHGATSLVHEYFIMHPGTDITMSELREAFPKFDERAIQNAVSFIRSRKGLAIETLAQGRVWRYRPNSAEAASKSAPAKRMFEELAVTKTGDIIIQDEEGKVYRAVEL